MTRSGSMTVAAGIALSRVAGLVRESLVRGRLGLGGAGDSFTNALRIPNLLQNLLGEGVLSASFIPVYSAMVDEDERAAARLANTMFAFLLAVVTPVVLLGVVAAGPLTRLVAPGLDDARHELTTDLVQIMTPGVGVLVLSAWSLGVLNSHRSFFVPYAAPVIWNLTQIVVVLAAGTGVLAEDLAVTVAWAVTGGAVLQLLVQVPALRRVNGHLGRGGVAFAAAPFRDVLGRLGPVILGRGSAQISAFIDIFFASLLATGAIAAIGIAQVLYLLPISLFAMSVAAAELPEMSRLSGDARRLGERLELALETVTFWMAFTTVAYVLAGRDVVGAIFSLVPGSLLDDDAQLLVAIVLAVYALGLPAIGGSRVMQNTFYALGDTQTPARVAVTRYIVSALVAVFFMFQGDQLFVYDGTVTGLDRLLAPLEPLAAEIRADDSRPLRLGAAGLAVGATFGAWTEALLLRMYLRAMLRKDRISGEQWRRLVLPTLVAALMMLLLLPIARGLHDVVAALLLLVPAGSAYVALAARQRIRVARRLLRRGSAPSIDTN